MKFNILGVAAVMGFLAVAIGAFGAHLLPNYLAGLSPDAQDARLEMLNIGARYHMYHALAIFGLAVLHRQTPSSPCRGPAVLMTVGTILFSGSLYALSLSGRRWLGAITPAGGLCFLVAWAWVAWIGLNSPVRDRRE